MVVVVESAFDMAEIQPIVNDAATVEIKSAVVHIPPIKLPVLAAEFHFPFPIYPNSQPHPESIIQILRFLV